MSADQWFIIDLGTRSLPRQSNLLPPRRTDSREDAAVCTRDACAPVPWSPSHQTANDAARFLTMANHR